MILNAESKLKRDVLSAGLTSFVKWFMFNYPVHFVSMLNPLFVAFAQVVVIVDAKFNEITNTLLPRRIHNIFIFLYKDFKKRRKNYSKNANIALIRVLSKYIKFAVEVTKE